VRTRPLAALALAVLLSACASTTTGGSHSASPPASPATSPVASGGSQLPTAPATDWLQYHGNGARTGAVAGLPAAGPLSIAWSASLGGAVYGQPLVVGDIVIAATERDEIFGLDRATGAIRWHVRVGTPVPLSRQPCGDIDPLGITGTGVYDSQTQLAYFVAQSGPDGHVLVGVDPANGSVRLRRTVPSPEHQPADDQQRGALALGSGYVYVVYGGHFGDCGDYIGSVVAMPIGASGAIHSYLVPTAKQGGIWSSGGPAIGPDGTVYVSVGNGAAASTSFDGSNSVTALTPTLTRTGIFAPTDWRQLSANDQDLGSSSPALLGDGRILQVGKDGTGYLLDATRLGGVGGQLAAGQVCSAFGGPAVQGTVVYEPCLNGLAAVSTAGGRVRVRWRGPGGANGSPVLGGGAVWVAGWNTGRLYELAPRTGAVRQQLRLGAALPHFVSPSLSGSLVLIGTMTGVEAVSGA
jgi:polyvinyl alcohol dehydrogenase (cytochrome)